MTVGLPREFDPDLVEDAAMKLFWELGYDGAADTVSGDPHGCPTVGDAPGLAELRDATVRQLAERFDAELALAGWPGS